MRYTGGVLWLAISIYLTVEGISAAPGNNTFCVASSTGNTPSLNATLPECHDLSWYAENMVLPSEVTLVFTSGDHWLSIGDLWWIQNLSYVSFVGYGDLIGYQSSVYNTSLSRILCSNQSGIAFKNVTQLSISNLIISGCGAQIDYNAADPGLRTALYFDTINNLTISSISTENSVGIGISLNEVKKSQIQNSIFIRNQDAILSIASTINMLNSTIADNYRFGLNAQNSAIFAKRCMFSLNSDGITFNGSQQVLLDSCIIVGTTRNRGLSLIMTFINITNSSLTQNAQGAITATEGSIIFFSGIIQFENNTSLDTGGAIQLLSSSIMVLVAPVNITFTQNSAPAYGGAIYTATCDQTLSTTSSCFFDVYDINGTLGNPGVHMTFQNNVANISGSVLYGNNLDTCTLNTQDIYGGAKPGDVFETICDYKEHNNSLPKVSSDAFNVCICYDDIPYCNIADVNFTAYPGQSIQVSVITAGQRNGSSPTPIIAYYCRPTQGGCSQYVLLGAQLPQKECSLLDYTPTKNLENNSILLVSSFSSISRPNFFDDVNHLFMHINTLGCPLGFELDRNGSYICICDSLLRKHNVTCDIKKQIILRGNDIWVGQYNNMSAVHDNCPFNYCKGDLIPVILSDENGSDVQCALNRTGLICGTCAEGLSVTFGSGHCEMCSDISLFLLLLFMVAGLILVILLFVSNLTITTGSINGLIYFANVVNISSASIFPSYGYNGFIDFLSVLISWINLDFGIPLCFYDGMDTYGHTWLQFVFPLYILILASCIIIMGKFSISISRYFRHNTVPVLATLMLLSFSKLLRTVITAFAATRIYVGSNDDTIVVWTYDGTVRYLEPKHAILFTLSLVLTIGFIAPYTLLLLFAPLLQRYSEWRALKWVNRLKPFIDAHYGPYEDRFRVWTGVLLLARIAFYFVFAVNLLNDSTLNFLVIIIVQSSLLFVPTVFAGGMYKTRLLSAVEFFYHINLSILAGAYLYASPSQQNKAIISGLLVGAPLLCFLVTIAVQVWLIAKKNIGVQCGPTALNVTLPEEVVANKDINYAEFTPQLTAVKKDTQFSELREVCLEI